MDWYLSVLKRFADFNGRARRKEYWMFVLFNTLAIVVLSILDRLLGLSSGIFSTLYFLATLVPSLAVGVRRLHDTERSGWLMLLAIIPLAGLVLLVFMALEGTPGPNRFGPNPKEGSAPTAVAV
ncbi:MAG TPA: DUF805 domain-containing protein [Myxococcaceae bacterium]|nr:DUF805 domain-containing protein [Myxococcaceae bacterium]